MLAELARHFAAAVPLAPVDKAVDYGRRAAAQAVRSAAYEEAASHLDAVLGLGASDFQRAQALIELAAVRLRVGLNGPSRTTIREAFTLACGVGAVDVAAEAALLFELATHMPGLPGGPAVELLNQAIDLMGDSVTPLRVRLQRRSGAWRSRARATSPTRSSTLPLLRRDRPATSLPFSSDSRP